MFPVISQYYFPSSSHTQSEKEIQQLSIPSPKEKEEEKVWTTKEPVSDSQTSYSVVLLNVMMINLHWKLQMSHQIPTSIQMGWAGINKWKAFVLTMSAESLSAEKFISYLELVFYPTWARLLVLSPLNRFGSSSPTRREKKKKSGKKHKRDRWVCTSAWVIGSDKL